MSLNRCFFRMLLQSLFYLTGKISSHLKMIMKVSALLNNKGMNVILPLINVNNKKMNIEHLNNTNNLKRSWNII